MPRCEQCGSEGAENAGYCRQCGAAFAGPDPLLGKEVLGRYRVTRLIGEGGMGRVYEAQQRVGTTARRVAVKVLRPQLSADPQLARRFFREAETIVRLTHPNTIQFFDFGETDHGALAIVMEYIEGHSLADELVHGPLDPGRVEHILAQVCGALAEAHALGIVHRDLKPDNILLTERGGQRDFVKVLDFGIAKISAAEDDRSTRLTQQGMMVGTPPYMSPEQFSGDAIDARSDIYSLGVIAYEMLTGRLPFDARTPWEWASKHLTAEPNTLEITMRPGVSERRAQAIRRALAKRPQDRPDNVGQLLAEFCEQVDPPAQARVSSAVQPRVTAARGTPVTSGSSASLPMRTLWPRPIQIGLGVLLLACIGGLSLWWSKGETNASQAHATLAPPALPRAELQASGAAAPPPAEAQAPREHAALSTARRVPSGQPARAVHASADEMRAAPRRSPAEDGRRSPSEDRLVSKAADTATRATNPTAPEAHEAPPAATHAAARPAADTPVAPAAQASVPARKAAPAQTPTASARPDPAMADLQARVDRALALAPQRVETAIGLYQAAAARYGEHQPALTPLRHSLAQHGEARVRELILAKRCAQAQALLRALRAIGAQREAERHFGDACPLP